MANAIGLRTYSFTLTAEEYAEMQLLYLWEKTPSKGLWQRRASYFLTIVFGIAIGTRLGTGKFNDTFWAIVITLSFILLLLEPGINGFRDAAGGRRLRRGIQRIYANRRCNEHNIEITQQGLIDICPCGKYEMNWTAFTECIENVHQFVLVSGGGLLIPILKRVLEPPEVELVRKEVQAHVPHWIDRQQ